MKPEHGVRRTIIREWMSLPQERRRSVEQAAAFAAKAADADKFNGSGDPVRKVLTWLLPRIGRN